MKTRDLQDLCELGQRQLMRMEYLEAEHTLAAAEQQAWDLRDFDTLARLYMPLQEARRQRRQRCAEGLVCLDLIAQGPGDRIEGRHVVENYPSGQLLVGGWGTLEPSRAVRRLADEHLLYVETFLAAVYPSPRGRLIVVAPLDDVSLPGATTQSTTQLELLLPKHCIILRESDIPQGVRRGDVAASAWVMGLWERLHGPFLAAADAEADPMRKIEAYRTAIRVDYACELAHQNLAQTAHTLAAAHVA